MSRPLQIRSLDTGAEWCDCNISFIQVCENTPVIGLSCLYRDGCYVLRALQYLGQTSTPPPYTNQSSIHRPSLISYHAILE